MFIHWMIYTFSISMVLAFCIWRLPNRYFEILLILLWFIPFVILKKLKSWYTQKIYLDIKNTFIKIKVDNQRSTFGVLMEFGEEMSLNFDSIKSFGVKNVKYQFKEVYFNLRSNKTIRFSFIINPAIQSASFIDNLISQILLSIAEFNGNENSKEHITLKASFFSSKLGFRCILLLVFIFFLIIILVILNKASKAIPGMVVTFIILLQIILRRFIDNREYRELKSKFLHYEGRINLKN